MRLFKLSCALLPSTARATNIVISNDDGWAEINIRTLYNTLTAAGDSVVLSAPAENESGTGSPAEGNNASNTRLNYVNSYPVTSMRYGIQTLSPTFFGGAPDIAVAGFNVGANLGSTVLISGTVGAATEASKEGIPAIAFSGITGSQTGYTAPVRTYMTVYADLSANVTQSLVASGKPYLPSDVWLNVNFPAVSDNTCSSPADVKFVLSRINSATSSTAKDVKTCGSTRLPTESKVVDTSGCYASISVGNAVAKTDANTTEQAIVFKKLQSILSCLPNSSDDIVSSATHPRPLISATVAPLLFVLLFELRSVIL